jgi:hypothetical protein
MGPQQQSLTFCRDLTVWPATFVFLPLNFKLHFLNCFGFSYNLIKNNRKQHVNNASTDAWDGEAKMGRQTTPSFHALSPSSLHQWCPPFLHATWHANGGCKEGREHANCVCMLPPLLLCGPHLSAPWLVPPPPERHVCQAGAPCSLPHPWGSRHPASVQTGNVGWLPKGMHPHFSPLTYAQSNRQ